MPGRAQDYGAKIHLMLHQTGFQGGNDTLHHLV
jgi:hypothetical protein